MFISTLEKKYIFIYIHILHQTHKNANETSKKEEKYIQLPTRCDETKNIIKKSMKRKE